MAYNSLALSVKMVDTDDEEILVVVDCRKRNAADTGHDYKVRLAKEG